MQRRQRAKQRCLREDQARRAVLEHHADARRRIAGVERDVCAAGLECREERDQHVDRAFHVNADQHIRPHTALL